MYAGRGIGGKQYRVTEGDVVYVEKLGLEAGEKVEFDKVLVLNDDTELKVGAPYIEGACVTGEVVENGKAQKVVIFKYKRKKDYRKKQGHRQPFTAVEIKSLGGAPAAADTKADESPKAFSASMKKEEMIEYAKEHGIEIDEKATKAVIAEAITEAEK